MGRGLNPYWTRVCLPYFMLGLVWEELKPLLQFHRCGFQTSTALRRREGSYCLPFKGQRGVVWSNFGVKNRVIFTWLNEYIISFWPWLDIFYRHTETCTVRALLLVTEVGLDDGVCVADRAGAFPISPSRPYRLYRVGLTRLLYCRDWACVWG